MPSSIQHFYRFGDYTVDIDQRVLLYQGKSLPLTPKAFDVLLILVENSGRIVEKNDLMSRLWPNTFVEDANLTFNIQQLRKSLGDNARKPTYIETKARRGYRFIANVEEVFSDGQLTNYEINQRFESPNTGSVDAINVIKANISPQKERALDFTPNKPISENHLDEPAGFGSTAPDSRKGYAAIAAATLLVLVVAGLLWKYSNFSEGTPSGAEKVASNHSEILPIKLETLTQTGQSSHAAISPDGKYLAYTNGDFNRQSIWLRQLAANTNVEIVPAGNLKFGLVFANSGEYLYFARGDASATLYRVSFLGGVPTKIADNVESCFSISDDDSQITFVRQAINRDGLLEYSLIIVGSDGSNERTLLRQTHPAKLDTPVWSLDGGSIICALGSSVGGSMDVSIVEVKVADSSMRELTSARFFRITRIACLPQKSGLIMSARKGPGDNNQLWRLSYPSLEIRQITEGLISYLDLSLTARADKAAASQETRISDIWVSANLATRDFKKITNAIDNFCWTPTGRLIYSSMASGNRDLWIMQPDGTEQKQLTVNAAVNGTPAVTADNRYVVFISNRTGSFQVWRMEIDGSGQFPLTNGPAKNYPTISPDGKWVLYNSTDDWHLWKVSINGGEPLRLTDYPASYPSPSRDGKTIACVGKNESNELSILILPIEGGPPLKRIGFSGRDFSGCRIQWTADGKGLIYAVERNGSTAIIKQLVDGGVAEELAVFNEDELFDFGYSVDSRFLAVTRGGWQHDIVLISDLNRY